MDREPVFTESLRPRGLGWGVATAIQVPSGDMLVFDVERAFEAGPVEPETVRRLDALRPHLARAALVTARLRHERVHAATEALDLIGLATAVVGADRRAIMMNARFESMIPAMVQDRRERVALTDPAADALLCDALACVTQPFDQNAVRSLPIGRRRIPRSSSFPSSPCGRPRAMCSRARWRSSS
jgi:hypothetical protein